MNHVLALQSVKNEDDEEEPQATWTVTITTVTFISTASNDCSSASYGCDI